MADGTPRATLSLTELRAIAEAVPEHLIHTGWRRDKNPVFGSWFVYADDGRGMGRQLIASTPASKSYGFTDLSAFIGAFDPPTVLDLIGKAEAVDELLAASRLFLDFERRYDAEESVKESEVADARARLQAAVDQLEAR